MKAKVIARNLEEYGQIIDVVLNQYIGKYTDGKKQYANEALSFDDVKEESIGDDEELNELAFALLCAKESASKELLYGADQLKKIRHAFETAELFQLEVKARKEIDEEKARAAAEEPVLDNSPREGETDEETENLVQHEDTPEIGLSDLISQLN